MNEATILDVLSWLGVAVFGLAAIFFGLWKLSSDWQFDSYTHGRQDAERDNYDQDHHRGLPRLIYHMGRLSIRYEDTWEKREARRDRRNARRERRR